MIYSPLALSLTNSITKIGAIAAFAALLGIAILALLVFAQAREIKRLREWAGRAPERAAEHEQRVSSQAAARAAGVQAVQAARPVPRATPLNVRAAAATGPASRVLPDVPVPAGSAPAGAGVGPAMPQTQSPAAPVVAEQQKTDTAEGQGSPATQPAVAAQAPPPADAAPQTPAAAPAPIAEGQPQSSAVETVKPQTPVPAISSAATETNGPAAAQQTSDPKPAADTTVAPTPTPAPATAAARAARSPLPPAPTPESDKPAARVGGPEPASWKPRTAAETVAPARRVGPPDTGSASTQRRGPQGPPSSGSYKFLTEEDRRSPARTAIMALVGLLVVAVIAIVLISALGKGGSTHPGSSTAAVTESTSTHRHSTAHHGAPTGANNPASVSVSVLNGTETNNLAHHLAASIGEKGYTNANPLDGHPPGTYPKTLVEYTSGHRADAVNIAKLLELPNSAVEPMEATTQPLVGGAAVAVIAGVNEATKFSSASQTGAVPSGGESSASAGGG